MAVQQGYGKMAGANSLVFAYDITDTKNSFKGEPTENMITGNMNTSGAASLGSDAGGDYIQLGNNTSGYAAIVVPNIYILHVCCWYYYPTSVFKSCHFILVYNIILMFFLVQDLYILHH
jgi:hypothetical protein